MGVSSLWELSQNHQLGGECLYLAESISLAPKITVTTF